jgi:hypothetical protein
MTKQISPERKKLYNAGLVMIIIGGCLFGLPFLAIPLIMIVSFLGYDGAGPPKGLIGLPIVAFFSFIGFGLIVGGGAMRIIAAKGKAGSGLVLDPEQAREDLEPWARAGGGIVKDALEEADINLSKLGGGSEPEKIVMIKCRECGKLNEEDSKFCQECGKSI